MITKGIKHASFYPGQVTNSDGTIGDWLFSISPELGGICLIQNALIASSHYSHIFDLSLSWMGGN